MNANFERSLINKGTRVHVFIPDEDYSLCNLLGLNRKDIKPEEQIGEDRYCLNCRRLLCLRYGFSTEEAFSKKLPEDKVLLNTSKTAMRALRASRDYWVRLASRKRRKDETVGTSNCVLCRLYWSNACYLCPVAQATGEIECTGTPYDEAHGCFWEHGLDSEQFCKAAADMRDYLTALLEKLNRLTAAGGSIKSADGSKRKRS